MRVLAYCNAATRFVMAVISFAIITVFRCRSFVRLLGLFVMMFKVYALGLGYKPVHYQYHYYSFLPNSDGDTNYFPVLLFG